MQFGRQTGLASVPNAEWWIRALGINSIQSIWSIQFACCWRRLRPINSIVLAVCEWTRWCRKRATWTISLFSYNHWPLCILCV